MLLAEALAQRADLQKRMTNLRARLEQNAQVQEGEQPAEDANQLIADFETAAVQLERLIRAINRTNSATMLPTAGVSMTDALATRDVLKLRIELYRGVATAATPSTSRYSRTEIRQVPQVSVAAMQGEADRISAEHRQLDNAIQLANWATTLIEEG